MSGTSGIGTSTDYGTMKKFYFTDPNITNVKEDFDKKGNRIFSFKDKTDPSAKKIIDIYNQSGENVKTKTCLVDGSTITLFNQGQLKGTLVNRDPNGRLISVHNMNAKA